MLSRRMPPHPPPDLPLEGGGVRRDPLKGEEGAISPPFRGRVRVGLIRVGLIRCLFNYGPINIKKITWLRF